MKGLCVYLCLLTVSVKFGHREWAETDQNAPKQRFTKHELYGLEL